MAAQAQPALPLDAQLAEAHAVVDASSGYVFDSANLNRKLQVGSLTKIATAMVVLDWLEAFREIVRDAVRDPDVPVASLLQRHHAYAS